GDMPALFDALEKAGKPHGMGFFGAYAMNSMRIEKGYRAWGADFTTERSPAETGAGPMIRPEGRGFVGREALLRRMAAEDRWDMVLLEVDTDSVDPFYSHAVLHDGKPVGIVTSGTYGHRTGQTLALAYLRQRDLRDGLTVEILGRPRPARVLDTPPYDPTNERMKA
ncbi:MAG: glycine cleavage T C-terminal barrel domain-containing protein, partial [Defluviimonas denitrificans]